MFFPSTWPIAPPINRPIPAKPQMVPMPAAPRWKTRSPKRLKRICAAPPPLAHPTVTSPMPRTHDLGFRQVFPLRAEVAGRHAQPRNTSGGDQERQRIEDERPLVAELHHAGSAEQRTDGERHPNGGLADRIRRMNLLAIRDDGEDGGPAAGKKRRGKH